MTIFRIAIAPHQLVGVNATYVQRVVISCAYYATMTLSQRLLVRLKMSCFISMNTCIWCGYQRHSIVWLGHESPTAAHTYIEADLSMKVLALARLQEPEPITDPYQE